MTKRVTALKSRGKHYVAEWREFRSFTQQELADRMGTTNATISRVESHKNGYTQGFLEACAEALSCKPHDLLSGPPGKDFQLRAAIEKLSGVQKQLAIKLINALADEEFEDLAPIEQSRNTSILERITHSQRLLGKT